MMIRYAIADVELHINSRPGIEIRERNPVRREFIVAEPPPAFEHQIDIEIVDERMPEIDPENIIFDADAVWTLSRDDRFYWVVSHPPALPEPLWVARFDHRFSHGKVYCGDRLKDICNDQIILYNPVVYPLDQILLMHFLAGIGGMLIHAAGWKYHDSGWIFAGKSGAGKSTLSNLIVEETGETFLSDDRIVVRKIGHEYSMYGTPWPGDAGYAINQSVPLRGIFFLSKGNENIIKKLKPSDAIPRLMPVVSVPWYDREKVGLMMDFCHIMIENIPIYELSFIPDKKVVDRLAKFINEQSF